MPLISDMSWLPRQVEHRVQPQQAAGIAGAQSHQGWLVPLVRKVYEVVRRGFLPLRSARVPEPVLAWVRRQGRSPPWGKRTNLLSFGRWRLSF